MESSPSSKDNLDAPDSLKLFKLLVAGAGRLGLQEISFGFLGRQAWPKSSILRFDLVPSTRWIRARRSEEHTSELQSHSDLVCRLLLEKKKNKTPLHLEDCIG